MKKEYDIPTEIRTSGNATDLYNLLIGKVKVLYPVGHETKHKHLLWLCKCECGTLFTTRAQTLMKERIRSCGKCEHEDPRINLTEIPYQLVEDTQEEANTSSPDEPLDSLIDELESGGINRGRASSEFDGLITVCDAIEDVPEAARERVLNYVRDKYIPIEF